MNPFMHNPLKITIQSLDYSHMNEVIALHSLCFRECMDLENLSHFVDYGALGFVAFHQTELVGFILAQTVLDTADIITLCTHPHHRRRGVAEELVRKLIHTFVGDIFLEVSVYNHAAIRLYERFGFKNVGHRKAYYTDGSDAHVMKLRTTGTSKML
jgi:ribosomal-protein-alanine N-acetyltransferase